MPLLNFAFGRSKNRDSQSAYNDHEKVATSGALIQRICRKEQVSSGLIDHPVSGLIWQDRLIDLPFLAVRLVFLFALAMAFAPRMVSQLPPRATPEPNVPTGVFRFQGLAGKCLDVGGYPLGHTAPAMLYDCNGTTAQDLTLVPYRTPIDSTVEIRVQGRCLGVSLPPMYIGGAPLAFRTFSHRTRGGLAGFARTL